MSEKNLIIITKILFIYSLFYIVLKTIIIFQGAWLLPNLLLMAPFVALGLVAGLLIKQKRYSWPFVFLGALVVILVRIFESKWVVWLHQVLSL